MVIELQVFEGPYAGQVFRFDGHEAFVVGRGEQADFKILRDRFFSRLHFMIEVNPPQCRLTDLESTNGTYVNRQRAPSAELRDGDEIRGGDTAIRVRLYASKAPDADPPPTMAARKPLAPEATAALDVTLRPVRPPSRESAQVSEFAGSAGVAGTQDYVAISSVHDAGDGRCAACHKAAPAKVLCDVCMRDSLRQEQIVPLFTIVREIGRGGMGAVFLAISHRSREAVAVKTIRPDIKADDRDVARFIREAQVLEQLVHPRIVSFREFGPIQGGFYYAMDLVRGMDGGRMLAEMSDPLATNRAVHWACQTLEALEVAHARGFVHRDVKPQNLIVEGAPPHESVKLADFGLARLYQESRMSGLTLRGDMAGTFAYMAPEQLRDARNAKPTADIYSTAATLYNLLTKRFVYDFPSKMEAQVRMLMSNETVPLDVRRPDLPPKLVTAVQKALSRDPEKRFANSAEFRRALLGS